MKPPKSKVRAKRKRDDVEQGVRTLAKKIAPMLKQVQKLQEQMRAQGLFPNDRELLHCPKCGLTESVTFEGQLYTFREPHIDVDTGLRFVEPKKRGGAFRCPECGCDAREDEFEPPEAPAPTPAPLRVPPTLRYFVATMNERHRLTFDERLALALIVDGREVSHADIAARLSLREPATLSTLLRRLVKLGIVERAGHGRTTCYFVSPSLLRKLGLGYRRS